MCGMEMQFRASREVRFEVDLREFVRTSRLRWYGFVIDREINNPSVKQVLILKVKGKCLRGNLGMDEDKKGFSY